MTPVFGHGHLRLYLLSLLAERPMHGYEIIQALSDRFGGTYIPSAGTIYPRLSKLGEEGLVTREADGRKTVYSVTDAGRAELEARRAELDDIESGVTESVRSLADEVRLSVNDAMRTLRADLAAAARETQGSTTDARASREKGREEGVAARRQLQEAELVLNGFRQGVRAELRRRAVRDDIPDGTAERLRLQLDEVLAGLFD
ncbi:PadR family transcriptional regulator [Homoserinimonas aerilata]|uniref:PadR family transcriptional regulator n=1 Tax=Homoserinimonas aerilata TaxID=1162970 RepID=A0A542XX57_9MICO|nr:PadR family transcriptional regulator [Homoserinimonas aerilata]TQL40426.1 PadR family transcriptional regulator [Homoserinimonas aerilata]